MLRRRRRGADRGRLLGLCKHAVAAPPVALQRFAQTLFFPCFSRLSTGKFTPARWHSASAAGLLASACERVASPTIARRIAAWPGSGCLEHAQFGPTAGGLRSTALACGRLRREREKPRQRPENHLRRKPVFYLTWAVGTRYAVLSDVLPSFVPPAGLVPIVQREPTSVRPMPDGGSSRRRRKRSASLHFACLASNHKETKTCRFRLPGGTALPRLSPLPRRAHPPGPRGDDRYVRHDKFSRSGRFAAPAPPVLAPPTVSPIVQTVERRFARELVLLSAQHSL